MSESHANPSELSVGARFNGPPDSANGGYLSGLLATRLGDRPATVTLRRPPPLETPMTVEIGKDGVARLRLGAELVAEAEAAAEPGQVVEAVPVEAARRAEEGFRGWSAHPFPTCFVCGTRREVGDGLRLFAGPVRPDDPTTVACVWTPDPAAAGLAEPTRELVWAALDCPGAWASDIEGRAMVLGMMTAVVHELPQAGRRHVVVGRRLKEERRKTFTRTALYGPGARLLAAADATWIALRT